MSEMERGLNSLFAVISAEAGRNPAFAAQIQEAVLELSDKVGRANLIDLQVRRINPFALFKVGGRDGMITSLNKEKVSVLREVVKRHSADTDCRLGPKSKKQDVIEVLVAFAERRAERDSRLFAY